MEVINKTGKTLNLNKSYSAKTRFSIDEDGRVNQQTVLYEENGSQKKLIFKTEHGELAITRKSAIMKFTFDRFLLKPKDIGAYGQKELKEMIAFLRSEIGQITVMTAEKLIAPAESNLIA